MGQSDVRLGPEFQEPLRCNLMMENVLSKAREEAYSAALGWALRQLSIGQVVDILRIRGLKFRANRWQQSMDWHYYTEVSIPEGHEGQVGRLDMTVKFQNHLLAAIEIKTREYTSLDTSKHRGYAKWID